MIEPQDVWRMSAVELDALWDILDLGERPYPLELPSPGTTFADREALLQRTWAEITGRGFTENGTLDARLAAALRVVAAGTTAIEAQIAADRHMRVRAALGSHTAGMVLQTDDTARVDLLPPTRWWEAFVALLPALPPVDGQSITVPAAALRTGLGLLANGDGRAAFEDELRAAGVGGVQARWLGTLASASELIGVQFAVHVPGRRPETVSWYGSPDGGLLLLGVTDGAEWVSAIPAGRDQVAVHLAEAVGG